MNYQILCTCGFIFIMLVFVDLHQIWMSIVLDFLGALGWFNTQNYDNTHQLRWQVRLTRPYIAQL